MTRSNVGGWQFFHKTTPPSSIITTAVLRCTCQNLRLGWRRVGHGQAFRFMRRVAHSVATAAAARSARQIPALSPSLQFAS
jgi:hypothetical protein